MLSRSFTQNRYGVVRAACGWLALALFSTGCGLKIKALDSKSHSSAAILNLSPTAVPFALTYGAVASAYVDFCILKNNTKVDDCVWIPGQLPTTFDPGTHGTYVLSVWTRDSHGVVSARMDTNPVQYVAPVQATIKNIYGNPGASFTIGFSNALYSDLRLKFRDVHTAAIVSTSTVSASGAVTLPSKAGLYSTELVDTKRGGVSYGFATVTGTISSWLSAQQFTPPAFGQYRAWPDYTRAIGDYTGDGNLDFAYAEGTNGGGASVAPGIYLYKFNSGTGQYVFDARLVPTHTLIYGMRFVDIDGDGKLDIVYGRSDTATFSAGLCYMMNSGGTFGAPTCLMDTGRDTTHRSYVYQLAVADIDRDGHPDVVMAGGLQNGAAWTETRVWIYHNTGSGFAPATILAEPSTQRLTDVKIADMDDDGRLDIVAMTGDDAAPSQISIYGQAWDGTFSVTNVRRVATPFSGLFTLGYLNGDGKPDIIATSQGQSGGGFYLQSNAADGTYASSGITSPAEQFSAQNWVADLNLDGTPEVYFSPKNRLLYTNKTGIYSRSVASFAGGFAVNAGNSIVGGSSIFGWNESNFDFADLNGDGIIDILYYAASPNIFEFIKGQ